MQTRHRAACRAALLAWLSLPLLAAGQQSDDAPFAERFGEYTVLYSVVRSDSLPQEMARRHGLPADSNAALLNVTVRRGGENVRALISATATNLAEQARDIEMHASVANDLVSYVGVVEIADREVLDFDLELLPEGAGRPIRLRFREEFLPQPDELARP